jgi:hypothetical protein
MSGNMFIVLGAFEKDTEEPTAAIHSEAGYQSAQPP